MFRALNVTRSGAHAAPRRPRFRLPAVLVLGLSLALAGCLVALRPAGSSPASASNAVVLSPNPLEASKRALPGLERLVVYGHSIPSGVGASTVSQGYAVLAADIAGLRLVNHAYGGTRVASAARMMASAPPAGPEDAVVIHTGLNDIFRRGHEAVPAGRVWIRELLRGTTGAGVRVLVLECQPASWRDTPPRQNLQGAYEAWNDMLRDVATFWPDVALVDTCETWDPQLFTDDSQYHPNDEGHARLARALVTLLGHRTAE